MRAGTSAASTRSARRSRGARRRGRRPARRRLSLPLQPARGRPCGAARRGSRCAWGSAPRRAPRSSPASASSASATRKAAEEGSPGTRSSSGGGARRAARATRASPRRSAPRAAPGRARRAGARCGRASDGLQHRHGHAAGEPGEEHGALHLRAGRARSGASRPARGPPAELHREPVGLGRSSRKRAPIARERLGDAAHGAGAQRGVAGEGGAEGRPARSPIISRAVVPLLPQSSGAAGARQPSSPGRFDAQLRAVRGQRGDGHAQGAEHPRGAAAVLAGEEAGEAALAAARRRPA